MEKFNAAITIESKPLTKSVPIMAERTDIAANPNDQVRVVGPDDCLKAAECLAEAFMDDDVAKYFIFTEPGSPKTWTPESLRLHYKICEYLVYAHYMKGLVTIAGPNYDSVALWLPPGRDIDDWFTMFKSGMWRLRYQLNAEGCKRFFAEFLPLLSRTKATALGVDDSNSWYLVYIGTKPGSGGKGYAKALIEMVTQQADAEGLKCYLESSHEKNLQFYKKRGFKQYPEEGAASKIYLTRDKSKSIELDIMVRNPAPKEQLEPPESRDFEKRDSVNGVHPNAVVNSTA